MYKLTLALHGLGKHTCVKFPRELESIIKDMNTTEVSITPAGGGGGGAK